MKKYFLLACCITTSVCGMESTPATNNNNASHTISIICEGHEPIEISQELVKRSGMLADMLECCATKDSIFFSDADAYKEIVRLKKILCEKDVIKNHTEIKEFKDDADLIDALEIKDLYEECSKKGKKFIYALLSDLPDCATSSFRARYMPNLSGIKNKIKKSAQKIYEHDTEIDCIYRSDESIIFSDVFNIYNLSFSGHITNTVKLFAHKCRILPGLKKIIAIVDNKLGLYTYDFKKIKDFGSCNIVHVIRLLTSWDEKYVSYVAKNDFGPTYALVEYEINESEKSHSSNNFFQHLSSACNNQISSVSAPYINQKLRDFEYRDYQSQPQHIIIAADEKKFITRKLGQEKATVWDMETLKKKKSFYTIMGEGFGLKMYKNCLINLNASGQVQIWDIKTGNTIMAVPSKKEQVEGFANFSRFVISPENEALYVTYNKAVWKYNLSALP